MQKPEKSEASIHCLDVQYHCAHTIKYKCVARKIKHKMSQRSQYWFGHVMCVDKDICIKKCQLLKMSITCGRKEPCKTWDNVEKANLKMSCFMEEITKDHMTGDLLCSRKPIAYDKNKLLKTICLCLFKLGVATSFVLTSQHFEQYIFQTLNPPSFF